MPVPLRGRIAIGGEHEKLKSRPSSFVQEHGPVLGKSFKSGSGALRPSYSFRRFASRFLVKDQREYEIKREDETRMGLGFGV